MLYAAAAVTGALAASMLLAVWLTTGSNGQPDLATDGAGQNHGLVHEAPRELATWLDRPLAEIESAYAEQARLLRADAEAGAQFVWRQMPRRERR